MGDERRGWRLVQMDRRQLLALAVVLGLASILSLARYVGRGGHRRPAGPLLSAPKGLVYPADEVRARTRVPDQ